jgi:hypothetical protein
VKMRIYVLSALAAGLGGVVQASAGGSVAPYAASSPNDLLTILAAVIIGATALTGAGHGRRHVRRHPPARDDRERPRAEEHLELLPAGRDRGDLAHRDILDELRRRLQPNQ